MATAKSNVYLKDYKVPPFFIKSVDLDIDIKDSLTTVSSKLVVKHNPLSKDRQLFLNGENQKLVSVIMDGNILKKDKDYIFNNQGITIKNPPLDFVLEIVSTHNPYKNTALSGLYASGTMLSTQCEAQGFRRITFYPDRPDVLAVFTTTIHADKNKFPVLLSNGNLVAYCDDIKNSNSKEKRHFVIWHDPHPKPCYLFAMVAGNLDKRVDTFTTKSKRDVLIEIYVEKGKTGDTLFALDAIKKSMKWDEDRFGLEYDLDRFMMVATPFFNMGAMENKGLNIFNDACVLGKTSSATDATISFIERVIGHEYFHNWTGNRITCRDWFQISLKEGLTVFREQEYMGAMHSEAVERLETVRDLRARQFAEDAGAMSHPIQPDKYEAIDNFYTVTVYDKGSEVVRMIQTLVGVKGFNKGLSLYVKRHDGKAASCEDFIGAMADANKIDLSQFMLWYKQSGTPLLHVTSESNEKNKTLTLHVKQENKATANQPKKAKKTLFVPFAIGLLDSKGKDIIGTKVLNLKEEKQSFVFKNIKEKPVLSLLRNFSAPVIANYDYTDDELLFLLANDTDAFSKWEAGFKWAMSFLTSMILKEKTPDINKFINALKKILKDKTLDPAFKSFVLTMPSEAEIGLELTKRSVLIDPEVIYKKRRAFIVDVAKGLEDLCTKEYHKLKSSVKDSDTSGLAMGRRGLKNLCLSYMALAHYNDKTFSSYKSVLKTVSDQAMRSKNMTDTIAGLIILADMTTSSIKENKWKNAKKQAFAAFEKKWSAHPTVMDKWLALQSGIKHKSALNTAKALLKHPAFSLKNPNRVSALIGSFANNMLAFHSKCGKGYSFLKDMISCLDPINPQAAASLAKQFTRVNDYTEDRQLLMINHVKKLAALKTLSPNSKEVLTKTIEIFNSKKRK